MNDLDRGERAVSSGGAARRPTVEEVVIGDTEEVTAAVTVNMLV